MHSSGLVPLVISILYRVSSVTTTAFDSTSCGRSKSCFIPSDGLALSYNVVSPSHIDVELMSNANSSNEYVAVTFAGNEKTPSIECSVMNGRLPTLHIPNIDDIAGQLRTPNEQAFRESYFSNVSTSLANGTLYCRARLLVTGQNNPSFLTYIPSTKYTLTLSSGTISGGTRMVREVQTSPSLVLDANNATTSDKGLDMATRRRLNKAHAILMVLSWLLFVPTGILFARFLRESWSGNKPGGLAVWFHVHRTCNILAIVLMIASFICIMISKSWTWTGPGSTSKYNTKVHTMTGLLALILAWLQPFITLMRCSPSDRRRPYFNWIHRLTGVVAFALATTAFVTAALQFRIWPQHELQTVLVLTPTLVLVGLFMLFFFIEAVVRIDEANYASIHAIKLSLVFWAIGLLMAVCVWMTVLLADGYRTQ